MVDLKQGVAILYDLELNNYLMTNVIHKIKQIDSTLCKPKTITKQTEAKNQFSIMQTIINAALICGILGILVSFYFTYNEIVSVGALEPQNLSLTSIFLSIITGIVFAIQFIILGVGVGIAGGLVIGIIGKIVAQSKINELNEDREYEYSVKVSAEKKRMDAETNKRKFLRSQLAIVENKLAESKKTLEQAYNIVGIDKTFRNLICMGYMDEYLRLGIATKLTGVDGLYFVIKQQLNFDQINASLNVIIEKLDVIIDQQSQIYRSLQSLNAKCNSMVSELEKISYNTYSTAYDSAINTYTDERLTQEISYLNYINS